MILHYRRLLSVLTILGVLLPVRVVFGDLYQVLVGDTRDKPDVLFVAYPGVPTPDLDAAKGLSLLEQRAMFGGYHLKPATIGQTRGLFAEQVRAGELDSAVHRWTLLVRLGKTLRTFNVYENQWGDTFLQVVSESGELAKALVYKVHRERFIELIWGKAWWYAGPRPSPVLDPRLPKPGSVGEIPKPYIFGGVLFNEQALRSDLLFGSSSIAGTKRDLRNELFMIRLPRSFSPSTPAGLLVWIDGGDAGAPREQLFDALDAFNIVAVGMSNAGNERPLSDRVQLAMDAMETVQSRVLIDPSRVYVGGISGGGRVASMLAIAFPDRFHACLAVVGLNSFHNVALPDGKHVQRASGIPNVRVMSLLQNFPIAAITGPDDFNRPEILARCEALTRNHLSCKVFDFPGLGHQMPKASDLKDVIDWFDKARRESAEQSAQAADKAWADALATLPPTGSLSDDQRRELFKAPHGGAMSPRAWDALRRAYPGKVPAPESPNVKK